MISLIVKSYFTILFAVGLGGLLLFFGGLFLIIRYFSSSKQPLRMCQVINLSELHAHPADEAPGSLAAIAGDNVTATQLDLARAYIETNQFHAAKQLIDIVKREGNASQQSEADKLMISMSDHLFLNKVKKINK